MLDNVLNIFYNYTGNFIENFDAFKQEKYVHEALKAFSANILKQARGIHIRLCIEFSELNLETNLSEISITVVL